MSLIADNPPAALILSDEDDVAVLLHPGNKGDIVRARSPSGDLDVLLLEDIPQHHKVALQAIELNAPVRRATVAIGSATQAIEKGAWVHVHNLRSLKTRSSD